ncbi:Armadillo repeat-containing domain, partial [Trinorchestia longiramus]
MAAASSTFQDRTLNKVAVCSAVFAGFAYVGYSYARTAFCRKLSRRHGAYDDDGQEVSRVVFRRLSQTTQTDALTGSLEGSSKGRLIIRPKSVQARIRELNLRARQFSDAFVAIQGDGGGLESGVSRTHAMHTHHSLQCSPWSSPRLLSPVDVRGLTSSQSTENLTGLLSHTSPTRPKWARRSLRRKRRSRVPPEEGEGKDEEECMEVEVVDENEQERRERMERETREMYSSSKEQLIERLGSLMDRGRLLSPFEAKTLVALLCAEDTGLLERTLVTIANCATFTLNVDLLREAGCIVRLSGLLTCTDQRILLAAVQTLGNVLLAPDSILQAQ